MDLVPCKLFHCFYVIRRIEGNDKLLIEVPKMI
jgi:hypothetical protein